MKRRNRKSKYILLGCIIVFICILSLKIFNVINNPLTISQTSTIEVKEGSSLFKVLDQLEEQNMLKGKAIIKFYTKALKKDINIHTGNFILNPGISLDRLLTILTSTPSYNTIVVTIPEGYTIDKIAKRLEENSICTYDEFIKAVEDYELPEFIKDDSNKRYNLEGFLFPDTYHFTDTTTPTQVIDIMLNNFQNVMSNIQKELNITINYEDYNKIITIASLIQNECRVDDEARTISSVIYNRLNKSMNLQIDATVIYALGQHVETVLNSHLKIDSPYNTYKYSGLPVGPISNPGRLAIEAAINPEETDYLFYLLKDITGVNGEHYFTSSDEDFMNKRQEFGYNNI